MIVVDASAVAEVLLRTPAAAEVERRLFDDDRTLHAPQLIDLEVAQVVRRYALAREIDAERGGGALDNLAAMPIRRYAHVTLLPRIWQLRANFSPYDAAYVALAEMLEAPLLTRDRRLAGAAARFAVVELV